MGCGAENSYCPSALSCRIFALCAHDATQPAANFLELALTAMSGDSLTNHSSAISGSVASSLRVKALGRSFPALMSLLMHMAVKVGYDESGESHQTATTAIPQPLSARSLCLVSAVLDTNWSTASTVEMASSH